MPAGGINRVELHYADALAKIPDNTARARGVALGRAAAVAVLTLRADDGFNTPIVDTGFQEGAEPGEYRFAPGTPYVLAPALGEELTPFVLADRAQFRPQPPYPVNHVRYAFDLNEVKLLGGDGVITPSTRTAEQTQIALFWVENAPQLWNRVARAAAANRALDLWQSARLFGLLDLALADAYLGAFGAKFRYRFWRPVTAVQLADEDGNPATLGDPTWTPLQPTPATPAYDSEHAVAAGAASQRTDPVLRHRPDGLRDLQLRPTGGTDGAMPQHRHGGASTGSPRPCGRAARRGSTWAGGSAWRPWPATGTASRSATGRWITPCGRSPTNAPGRPPVASAPPAPRAALTQRSKRQRVCA